MTPGDDRILALDGPVGSGKGAIGQRIALWLRWRYLDSGALYRVLAYAVVEHKLSIRQVDAIAALAGHLQVECRPRPDDVPQILLHDRDISDAIRAEDHGRLASRLAVIPPVRQSLLELQRRAYQPPGLVADGRDMGTVVFPKAVLKVFLTASPKIRAQRRYKQLKEKGFNVNLPRLLQGILERDERDATRNTAPMVPAADARILDTSKMNIEESVAEVLLLLRQRLAALCVEAAPSRRM